MDQKFDDLERLIVPELDAILGKPFKILNDGFIRVIDYMGNDTSIVQAARVSYGKGTKKKYMDRGLIRYLIRHNHSTPFEMCEIKLHVRVPMDAWRQWIRHRTANVNEYSTRYSIAISSAQTTEVDGWRYQTALNRQGSEGSIDLQQGAKLTEEEKKLHDLSWKMYEERLEMGIAREQARKDLPLCTYTEAYWKIDLHNLLHFLRLRMDTHAQYEIRSYAKVIGEEIVKRWCPMAWEAFTDYRLQGQFFSAAEKEILAEIIKGDKSAAIKKAEEHDLLRYRNGKPDANLERMELDNKLNDMGIDPPWSE